MEFRLQTEFTFFLARDFFLNPPLLADGRGDLQPPEKVHNVVFCAPKGERKGKVGEPHADREKRNPEGIPDHETRDGGHLDRGFPLSARGGTDNHPFCRGESPKSRNGQLPAHKNHYHHRTHPVQMLKHDQGADHEEFVGQGVKKFPVDGFDLVFPRKVSVKIVRNPGDSEKHGSQKVPQGGLLKKGKDYRGNHDHTKQGQVIRSGMEGELIEGFLAGFHEA